MTKLSHCLLFATIIIVAACNSDVKTVSTSSDTTSLAKGSYGYDLNFLQQFDSVIVLKDGASAVIVSPKYQAKVFTSTAGGYAGKSFGWINYKAFSTPQNEHMNAYGGENRFWLGPEGGVYSLFFPKGKEMVFDNWKTPAPFDTEAWTVTAQNEQSTTLQKDMKLTNYAGSNIQLTAYRTISILSKQDIADKIEMPLNDSLKAVGYQTNNKITNTGKQEWNERTGMPCIWMLDMFNPSAHAVIIVPYKTDSVNNKSKIATTDYFGEIPPDRIQYHNGVLLFRADGKSRGKLGINPTRAKSMAGSYDSENKLLTVIVFDIDSTAKYLNQEWNTTKPPFSGDAVNAYNDGPLKDGGQMGPFYEIESVSPAAFLQPGASLSHQHTVLHFTGSERELDRLCHHFFDISLATIQQAFE